MGRSFALIVAAVGAGVAGVWGWRWLRVGREGHDVAARVVTAAQGPIEETVEATGSVVPFQRVAVQAPISGRIEELLVDEGSPVKTGQVIAWMSSSDRAAILDAARAQGPQVLRRWQDAYKPTPIVAPLSGVIILRNVVLGQTVSPADVIYAMSDRLIVLAQVDESDIGRIRIGMPARIVLDAFPDQPVTGAVFDILYEGKNVSNVITYGVKVEPRLVPRVFRSQMTANIYFVLRRKPKAVLLPLGAVVDAPGGGKRVLVPGPEDKPVSRAVTTGIESGDQVEIVSGVSAGERVLFGRGPYVPQQAPQSSPLTFGGKAAALKQPSEAPKKRPMR